MWTRIRCLTFLLILLLASIPSSAQEKQFTLGLISDKPVGRLREYAPLADYLAKHLKGTGIAGGKVIIAKNTSQMMKKIKSGEVDMVFESAFPTVEMSDKAGIKPELLVWKKGKREYASLIFVRKESPITELNDLKGKTVVFEDPQSTSAYLLPKTDLVRHGLTVLPLDENEETNAVRYIFGGEETNEAFFVIQKRADAGAFSSDDWDELPAPVKGELRVIHQTKPVIRFIASFRPGLPDDLRTKITEVLTSMHLNPEGQKILKKAAGTGKIERLSDSDHQSLEYVRELMRYESGHQ